MKRILPILPFAMLAAAAAYTGANWDAIPQSFPIHWSFDGEPNGWVSRNLLSVFWPALAGLLIVGMLVARERAVEGIGAAGIFASLLVLPVFGNAHGPAVVAGCVVLFAALVVAAGVRRADPATGGRWIWGFLYYNPDDPALLVPKRTGIGYTFNFARKRAWAFFAVLLAVPFLMRVVL